MSRESKQRRSAESRRRAGTYLQKLAWLAGFPADEHWHTLAGETLALDGERVSRSRRAARTAMREHGEALAALVGDVERWWAVVDATLAWCSARRGELDLLDHAPPRLAASARRLMQRRPALREAVVAAGVAWALDPVELARVLGWLEAHPQAAAELSLPRLLAVAQLARAGGDGSGNGGDHGSDALLALLAVDAPQPAQAMAAVEHVLRKLREGKPSVQGPRRRKGRPLRPARPAADVRKADEMPAVSRSRPLVEAWLDRLLTEESAVQRRAMQLLAVAQLAEAIGPWQVWEAASAPKLSRAMAFVGRDSATREELDNYSRLLDGVQKVKAAAPTSVQIEEALRNVMTLASSTELTALHAPMRRFLGAQPAGLGPHWRAKLFAHLAKLAAALPSPRLGWLWDELAAALEAGAPLAMLDPWRAVVASQWGSFLDQEMTVHARTRAQVRRVVQALVELARRGPVSACDLVELSEWLEVGLDVELVPELTARMRVAELRATPGNGLRQAALALVGPDLDALVATMAELAKLTGETTWLEQKQLRELLLRAVDAGAGWLLRAAFAAEQGGRVTALAASLGALPPKRWPMPPGDEAPAWIARYPEALAPALERLASVDAAAAATAKKKLAQDLPDPDDLRREIAALRERAPLAPSLAARLANLEARLATPPRPSPARLATLAQKLEQTAAAVGLERLSAAAFAEATARLLRTFGLSGWPDSWPTDRKTLQAVQALLALEPADRQLAARLLQARTGPPPWDLRDEPANQRFLERMRARGLSLERWFDDTPQRIIEMDEPLELALCADPLEVFQMGGHFQTCLSPGDINFFSVVANAADVNKRVLYARAPDGRVIGRCLLGLTDSGGLLVFHPYCHTSIDFFAVVSRFATELAAQLGTEVVPRGTLSTILARDWYDDGARDLTGRFAALRDPDNLDLTTIEPAALPARLALLLGRPLDDLTLPFVLDLPGLTRRPGLLASLAPALLACTTPRTRVEGAVLAMEVEARALADRLLGDFADTIELGGHSWREGAVLAQLRPSLTLARLRATRRRGVRSWRQESGARLLLAGMALEGLRRPRQAATMYRLALDADGHLRDVARGHLERIEHALAEAGGV